MMAQTKPEAAGPRMVTGWGQSDTHALEITSAKTGETIPNPHAKAGQNYQTISGREIAVMAANPASMEKQDAPWFIGSSYVDHDARSHDAQRENGTYHVLPVDIDKGFPSLKQVIDATEAVIGDGVSFIVYSSSSATADEPKWRVLFFIGGDGLPGVDYKDTQGALFDLYLAQGIHCDRALDRTGQLVFLPNVPPSKRGPDGKPLFYQYHLKRGGTLKLDAQSAIVARRENTRRLLQEAAQEATQRRSRGVTRQDGELSPVEHYNSAHSLSDTLARYGYERQGASDHWKSPNSTSGSYAVRVYEERAWVSLSGSDQAAGIGAQKDYCCFGDAFDLFVHYEHGGKYKSAVRAYGQEIRPIAVVVPLHKDRQHDTGDDLADDFGEPSDLDDAKPSAKAPPPEMTLDQWLFLSGDNEFYHAPTGRTMNMQAFNLSMSPITPKIEFVKADGEVVEKKLSASKTLIDHLDGVVAHSTMYRPDLPENDADVFWVDGMPFVNSYMPQSVPASDPDWRNKDCWKLCEAHMLNILGNEAGRLVIKWMAHNVQYPGRKILWAPIIVGVQGDGKTTISKMLGAAMGHQNVSPVSPESMFSEFTGWAEGACVKVLEEIRVHGNSRHNAMNKLKPLITNDQVEIVRKGKDGKQVVNVTNYLALTNYMDALALDEGDRRWGVFKTKFNDRQDMLAEFDDDYWDALHCGLNTQPGAIRGWLLNVPLDDFNRVAGPEVGEHKRAMIESTRSPDQIDVEEAIAVGWHGVTETVLATDCLNAAILAGTGQRLNSKRIANALEHAGWVRVPETLKWNGRNRRVWWKKSAMLGGASPAEYRAILDTSDAEGSL
jgi:hypothetical protein